jgi:hypothetical protein
VKSVQPTQAGFWNRSHHLDKMTFKELVIAYFQYPAIIIYLALSALALGAFAWRPAAPLQTAASIVISLLVYPRVWYALHRWVLHSQWMWTHAWLAGTWKRIHYDHHQDPNHLEVLFGALHTTLPTIAVGVIPLGWAIGSFWDAGFGGAAIAFAIVIALVGALAVHAEWSARRDQANQVAARYPWVARLSGGIAAGHPRRRGRA